MKHKLIMENWKRYTEYHHVFEDRNYITHALGIQLPINENNTYSLDSETKENIIQEHLLLEGFFSGFDPKKYTGDLKKLANTLYSVVKTPELIPAYIQSIRTRIIKGYNKKIKALSKWMTEHQMPTFASALENILKKVNSLFSTPFTWKHAFAVTGSVLGIAYLFDKLKSFGIDLATSLGDTIEKSILDKALNFIMNEFPNIAGKLFTKAASFGASGAIVWMKVAGMIIKTVNLAKNALEPMFRTFALKKSRYQQRTQNSPTVQLE